QPALQPLQNVDKEERDQAERQNRGGVLGPTLLLILANATDAIGQDLNWAQHRVQECTFAVEYAGHEQPNRLRQRQDQPEEEKDLQNADASHGAASKLFRLEHRPAEIHEQENGDDAGNDVIEHDGSLLRAVARFGDAPERDKPNHANRQVKQIKHE